MNQDISGAVTAQPTGYTGATTTSTDGYQIAGMGYKELTADAAENPGTFTDTGSDDYAMAAGTILLRPVEVVAPSGNENILINCFMD